MAKLIDRRRTYTIELTEAEATAIMTVLGEVCLNSNLGKKDPGRLTDSIYSLLDNAGVEPIRNGIERSRPGWGEGDTAVRFNKTSE